MSVEGEGDEKRLRRLSKKAIGIRQKLVNMKSYRDLIVWQKAMLLVVEIYQITRKLPDEEKFGLISQIRRSAISIPSNIAEGYGRNYTKDYIRFLQIARGSLFECQTQLEIAINLKFILTSDMEQIAFISVEIEKMLNSLINKLAD